MIILNLNFKGQRDYLRGTDFFSALQEKCAPMMGGYVRRLVFRRFARNRCAVVFDKPKNIDAVAGQGMWHTEDGKLKNFWLMESDRAITARYPFDEEPIKSKLELLKEVASIQYLEGYSTIETIVAVTKFLNIALSSDSTGVWIFGQLDLIRPLPDTWFQLRIERFRSSLDTFSRNRIVIDEHAYGEVRFIRMKA